MRLVRATRIFGSLAAVAFVGGWLASDCAEASCGDYVTVSGRLHLDSMHQGLSRGPASQPGAPDCSGPHCQRRAPAPTAPRGPLDFKHRDSACRCAAVCLDPSGSGALLLEPALLFSQAVNLPAEPPPRPLR